MVSSDQENQKKCPFPRVLDSYGYTSDKGVAPPGELASDAVAERFISE